MLKKDITFTNPFTEKEVTETHYFHISKADLVEMEMEEHNAVYEKDGEELTGMQAKLQRIVDSDDGKAIISEIKDFVRRSYGKKDGDRFLKSPEIWADFASSEAFSQLLFDLCTDAGAASEFINGIVPSNMEQIAEEVRQRAEKMRETAELPQPVSAVTNGANATEDGVRLLSEAEVREMDSDELKSGLATGRYKLS